MLKKIMIFGAGIICTNTYGLTPEEESQEQTTTVASGYLSHGNYLQNPYLGLPSQGGTASLSESGCFHPTPQKCKILKPSFLQT